MEEFFRQIARFEDSPLHEAPSFDEVCRFFEEHGMQLLGPPPEGWAVEDGRIISPAATVGRE
jgi:hypothetical protein